jgi:hypothetical protein
MWLKIEKPEGKDENRTKEWTEFEEEKQEVLGRINRVFSCDTTRTAQKWQLQPFFVAAGTSLPSY